MSKYIEDSLLFASINALVNVGEKEMKRHIPEDTGDLMADVTKEKANRQGNLIVGSIYIDPSGPSGEYAEFVNYGTSVGTQNYYKDGGRRSGGSPFLTSANGTQFIAKTRRYLEDNARTII